MFGLVVFGVLIAALIGLAIKLFLDYSRHQMEITWGEYFTGLAVISLVLTPLITWAGWSVAKSSNLSFNEYQNGWELQAVAYPIQCTRDGPCWYEYNCDPYLVTVSYSCGTSKQPRTCTRTETRYHSCPYVKFETSYLVKTTIGDFSIAEHRFPDNPQAYRWRSYHSIPGYVIGRAGVGKPQFWIEVENRVRVGRPGPVTKRASYDNYILASDHTILAQYSDAIDKLLAKKMLPELSRTVFNFYQAHKVYFPGPSLSANLWDWSTKVAYLNAALGSELQGDLHLVLVHTSDIEKAGSTPDEYTLALKAYWQNPKYWQDDALSKNAIVVVVGTDDGKTVSWARATTGMPLGNERMTTEIRTHFKGVSFIPEMVVGSIRGYFENQKVKSDPEVLGGLSAIIWGRKLKETAFKRISMTANDSNDVGQGFMYLASEIHLTGFQYGMILFLSLLGSGAVWWIAAANGIRDPHSCSGPFDFNRMAIWWNTQWAELGHWSRQTTQAIADRISGRRQ